MLTYLYCLLRTLQSKPMNLLNLWKFVKSYDFTDIFMKKIEFLTGQKLLITHLVFWNQPYDPHAFQK